MGFLFFWGTLYWFVHLSDQGGMILVLPAITALMAYLAVYFGLFGLCYAHFSSRPLLIRLFVLPSCWVALEFIREYLFTGFGWASLGHSQSTNLPMVQIADITGVFGISFLIVMVNVFILACIRKEKQVKLAGLVVIALLITDGLYGTQRLSREQKSEFMTVAVVQASIRIRQ